MKKRAVLAACIVIVVAVTMALLWPDPTPDVDPAPNAVDPAAIAAPASSRVDAVSTSRSDVPVAASTAVVPPPARAATPSPAGERATATVRVFGRMPTAVSFRVSGSDGVSDGRVRSPAADGTFSFDAMPITHCDIAGFGADGEQWRRHYERPLAEAKLDWDLGVVGAATERITVVVELHFAKEVVEALLACGHERIVVRVRDQDAGATPIVQHGFDLAALLREPSPSLHVADVEVRDAARPVKYAWDAVVRGEETWPFSFGVADAAGPRRQFVRLDLLPATVVRGTIRWPDGTAATDTRMQWNPEGSPPRTLAAGPGGGFCFVAAAGVHGTIECDGMASAATSHPRSTWPAAAGDVLTLQRAARIRFRVLGIDEQPIEDWQLATPAPDGRSPKHHAGGIGHELTHVLRAFPWVRIYVQPRGGVFTLPVPAEWFAPTDRVHDLRLADALPTGTVEVVAPRANTPPPGFRVEVTLERDDGVASPRVQSNGPKRWPWLVEWVPAGRYRARFRRVDAAGHESTADAVVTVVASSVAQLTLPD